MLALQPHASELPSQAPASPGHPLLSHQQRNVAAQLTAVAASAGGSPESMTRRIDALQGLARARGLPAREISNLKRRNLQVSLMHEGAILHVSDCIAIDLDAFLQGQPGVQASCCIPLSAASLRQNVTEHTKLGLRVHW